MASGLNAVMAGAGEEITVTKHPGRPFIAIARKASRGNATEVDNGATNGVIHVIDVVLS